MRLEDLPYELRIGICVLTETHLRHHEVKRVNFRRFAKVGVYCRESEGKIGGGVMILVAKNLKEDKSEIIKGQYGPVEASSVVLYPTGKKDLATLLTAIYIPPSGTKDLTLDLLRSFSREHIQAQTR